MAFTHPIPFVVSDLDNAASSLSITASSDNPDLVPVGNILIGGSGGNRTVTVTSVAGQGVGAALITVTVSDGSGVATESFDVTVVVGDVIGDANRDGFFTSSDLIMVFVTGEYEDNIALNSTWEEGDWNCDGDFTTDNLLLAFHEGSYIEAATRLLLDGNREETSRLREQILAQVFAES